MPKPNGSLTIDLSLNGVDEAVKKAERYVELLEEAKTLAQELSSINFEVEVAKNLQSKLIKYQKGGEKWEYLMG